MSSRTRTAVFLSYNGLLDLLGSSQILSDIEQVHLQGPVHSVSSDTALPTHARAVATTLLDRKTVAMPTDRRIYTRLLGAPHA